MASSNRTRSLAWHEHCKDCGAVFGIDELESGPLRFRLHLTVENTGEHGILSLALDGSRVFILDKEQAPGWIKSYSWLRGQSRTAWELYERGGMGHVLRLVDPGSLPRDLFPGERWSGWLEATGRKLVDDDVGLIGIFGPFRRESPVGYLNHITHDRTRPFIGLMEEVTVKPLSPWSSTLASTLAQLRCVWTYRFPLAGMLAGGIIGAEFDGILSTEPLLGLLGIVLGGIGGYHLPALIRRRRPTRPDS